MALTLEQLYDFVTEDEDDEGSACQALPADACTEAPRNFFLNAANGTATKLAKQLASPGLVLPWFLAALGAPTALTGFLVPVRRAGALLPQLIISGQLRQYQLRKWFYVAGGGIFALALLLMIPAAMAFSATAAGVAVLALLAVGSIGRGVSSVAFKDVLAKTIPEGKRGTLLAARATSGGLLALLAGVFLRLYVSDSTSLTPYYLLLATAAGLWFVGLALFAAIQEPQGATEGSRNALQEARAGWHLLQENANFRRFILARVLLLGVKLSVPFYTLHARHLVGSQIGGLGLFVIAISLANVLSSPLWGRFSDRSSRSVMMAGGTLAVVVGISALLFGQLPSSWQNAYVFAPIFLLIGFAQAGVRLGRKTYLVDGAPDEDRPLYVALTNTIVGVMTLLAGALGIIAQVFSVQILLMIFIALTAVGVLVAWRMADAEELAAPS